MSDAEFARGVIADLAGRKPGAKVSVVVRPRELASTISPMSVDPKSFPSAHAYRSALIANQKEAVRPEKEVVLNEALNLGLDASAAGTLNAVFVQGSAKDILQLLDKINYASVNFDKEF